MAREYLSLDLSPPAGSICYSHSTLAQVVKQGQGSQPVSVGVQLAPPPPPPNSTTPSIILGKGSSLRRRARSVGMMLSSANQWISTGPSL